MDAQKDNFLVSSYRIMDDGSGVCYPIVKYKDLTISELVNFLNTCPEGECTAECGYGCGFEMIADDEETLIRNLSERDEYTSNLDDPYTASTDYRFTSNMEEDKVYEYEFELEGNDVDGIAFFVGDREIYRTFPDYCEFNIPG